MSYSDKIFADGATAYWRLDETSGTTVNDEVGTNDGTYANTPTLGETAAIQDGTSVRFTSSSSENGTVAHNAALSATGTGYSVELWAKFNTLPTNNSNRMYIASKGVPGNANLEFGFGLFEGTVIANGNLFLAGPNWTTTGEFLDFGFRPTTGVWYHLVFTVTGTGASETWTAYKDGIQVDQITGVAYQPTQSQDLKIASQQGVQYFDGWVDELAIYDYDLSSTQVDNHYDIGKGTASFSFDAGSPASISTATFDATVVLPDYTAEPDTAAMTTATFDAVAGGGVSLDVDKASMTTATYDAEQTIVLDPQEVEVATGLSQSNAQVWIGGTLDASPTLAEIATALNISDADYVSPSGSFTGTVSAQGRLEAPQDYTETGDGIFYIRYKSAHEDIYFSVLDGTTIIDTKMVGKHFDDTIRTASITVPRATLNGMDKADLRVQFESTVNSLNDTIVIFGMWADLPGYRFPANVEEIPSVGSITTATFDATIEDDTVANVPVDNIASITTQTFDFLAPGIAIPQVVYPIDQTTINWLEQPEFRPLVSSGSILDGWQLVDELDDTASNPVDWVYAQYNQENSISFDPDAYSIGYQLPPMDNPHQPNQSHKIVAKTRRPDVFWIYNIALVQGNPSVYDANNIIGIWTPSVSADLITTTINLSESQVRSITDWSDLWIVFEARYGYIILQGSLPETSILYGVEFTAPSGAGVAAPEVDNTPQMSILTWDPTLTVTTTIPEPGQMVFTGHPAQVEPALPIQDQVIIASNTQPYFQVVDASTKSIAAGWPTVNSPVRTGTANAEIIAVGYENGVTFIDAATKTVASGWPTSLSRPPETMVVSEDGEFLAIGTVASSQTDSGSGTTVDALKVVNMLNKTTVDYPAINQKITALAFSEDGTKLAVGLADAPYLKIYNTTTLTEVTGYPTIENFVVSLRWHQNKLFVIHRGGDRLTVIDNNKAVEAGWPKLPGVPTGADWDDSKSRIAISYKNKLCIINVGTKTLDNNFVQMINGGHYSNDVEWMSANVVAVAFESYSTATGKIEYINISSRTYDSTWEAIAGDVREISRAGSLSKPVADITINIQDTALASFTTDDADVQTIQEVQVPTASITTATFEAIADTPDISIPIDIASISTDTYDAAVLPDDALATITNTPDVAFTAYVPTLTATAPSYKLVPALDYASTALDASELTSISLDTVFHDQKKIYAFRVGNISKNRLQYLIKTTGNNERITPGVEFSVDKITWSDSVQTDVRGNEISEVIYMKIDVPDNCYLGLNTFLLDISIVIGSEL